jgi:hypothetical protein
MIRLVLSALLALAALAPAATAAREAAGVVALRAAPAALDPARAYLLFRSSQARSGMMSIEHVLMRIPGEAEMAAYRTAREAAYQKALPALLRRAKDGRVPTAGQFDFPYDGPANAFATRSGEFLADGEMRTFLLEVPPGSYVLYGSAVGSRGLTTCNCLGTVRFAARAGVVTDLGALYADKVHKPSPLPQLEANLGPSMLAYGFVLGQAVVPAVPGGPVPAGLASLPVEPAEYHAVGLFREPGAQGINRLAPVPGVLGYDRGRVIDLRTGQPVP